MRANSPDPCRTCGACCSFSGDWPRFSTETEEQIAAIAPAFVRSDGAGMRCSGDRCTALAGTVGHATTCSVYEARPDVCRACLPGDVECNMARRAFGLSALVA